MGHAQTMDGRVVVSHLMVANAFWPRFRGLMFYKHFGVNDGLFLTPCQSVHTCFMNMPIDVLFLGEDNQIVYVIEQMRPWAFSRYVKRAKTVLECYSGTFAQSHLKIGDKLNICCHESLLRD